MFPGKAIEIWRGAGTNNFTAVHPCPPRAVLNGSMAPKRHSTHVESSRGCDRRARSEPAGNVSRLLHMWLYTLFVVNEHVVGTYTKLFTGIIVSVTTAIRTMQFHKKATVLHDALSLS